MLYMAESTQSTEELLLGGVQAPSVIHSPCKAENHRVDTSAPDCLLRRTGTEASTTEEPYEGKLHVGICAGGVGRPAFLPRRKLPCAQRSHDEKPGYDLFEGCCCRFFRTFWHNTYILGKIHNNHLDIFGGFHACVVPSRNDCERARNTVCNTVTYRLLVD